ncbi:hypothetical protein LCUFL03_310002 [Latilactobacillus curvatus]|nr:hypothetical protein WTH01_19120 [Weissella thailandensis]SMH68818.1 hypothetical protein LCUFL03_310002 [Latilactobacillus curvatus]
MFDVRKNKSGVKKQTLFLHKPWNELTTFRYFTNKEAYGLFRC